MRAKHFFLHSFLCFEIRRGVYEAFDSSLSTKILMHFYFVVDEEMKKKISCCVRAYSAIIRVASSLSSQLASNRLAKARTDVTVTVRTMPCTGMVF
jgi:hypothetical protein